MRFPRTLALLLLSAVALPERAPAQRVPLEQRIRRITDRPEFTRAMWGMQFTSLDSGRVVYALNPEKFFTPGSTTKVLTMGTAMGILGADHQFNTRVYRTGPVRDGVLHGNLVLLASGDPNLSARFRKGNNTLTFENVDHSYDADPNTRAVPGDPLIVLRTLARQVRDRGIRRISGHVIVDASLFPEGDRELGTGVVISPMVLNDNLVDVTVTPRSDGAPALLTVSPPTAYVRFINKVVTAAAGTRPRVRWSSDSMRTDGSRVVVASGVFPRGTAPILYSYAVPQPSRYAEIAFAEALRAEGVAASPRVYSVRPDLVRLRSSYGPANMVAEHRSAPLGEEVRVTLKVSQNLHASMMPFLLGALRGRDSATTGFDLEREFLTTLGLDVSGARQGDGAGGDAHFTPAFMVSFLGAMAKRPDANTFLTAMPVLGKDGTLWDIQQQSPAAGHVFAKTGTFAVEDPLNRKLLVTGKGLAGYMTTAQGERLAFAIYVNNVPVSTAPDEIKRVVGQALGEIAAAVYEGR